LRERPEDVSQLVNHFLKKYAPAAGKQIRKIHAASLAELCGYDWPGNVRQLENTVERAVALETSDELHTELPVERAKARAAVAAAGGPPTSLPAGAFPPEGLDMENHVAQIEKSLLLSALQQSGGVQTKASDLLKISYRSFRHLAKKYDL
jgi:two-component system response regulator PilR (NtrC family)